MSSREKEIKKARRLLSDKRLVAFLRKEQEKSSIKAVKLIIEELDSGLTLDEIFYTGGEFGFTVTVRKISADEFNIEFGCAAGPMAGDGGSWKITFNGDEVKSVTGESQWIS
jgi:hypothetical protein